MMKIFLKMTSPYDYLNSINFGKINNNINLEEMTGYVPFVINKSLSYFPDTLFFANDLNINYHIDPKLQFLYLINNIRPRKRFKKWVKSQPNELVDIICEYYKCNVKRANEILQILTQEQIEKIKLKLVKN